MSRIATASQWLRIDPDRKPEPVLVDFTPRPVEGVIIAAREGSILRRAA
jgi:hypothetical protein